MQEEYWEYQQTKKKMKKRKIYFLMIIFLYRESSGEGEGSWEDLYEGKQEATKGGIYK